MSELIEPNEEAEDFDHDTRRVENVSLGRRQYDAVRNLPGFKKKTHHIPEEVNARTQAFIAKLGSEQVKNDLDRVFGELRSAFRFKRTEIESSDWEEGTGSITTPYFRYISSVTQNPERPDESIWKRDICEITDPSQVLSESFAAAFGEVFDTVEFTPAEPIDLEAIIDRVESIDDDRVWIEYDRQITYCEVTLQGCEEKVHINSESFRIVHPQAEPPRALLDSLFRVQNRLLGYSESSQ